MAQDLYVGSNAVVVDRTFSIGTNAYSSTYVGFTGDAQGNTLRVSGGGTLLTNGNSAIVGYEGSDNSMVVSDGGTVAAAFAGYVGYLAGASGNSVTVTGPGSTVVIAEELRVSYDDNSSNSITVSGGGSLSSGSGYIGSYSQSSFGNSVLVAGTGSIWTNRNNLYVGENGTANGLVVSNGGEVSVGGGAFMGYYGGASSNNILVTGADSSLAVAEDLRVSFDANSGNNVVVSNGGRLSSGNGYIGSYSDASSSNGVLVTGRGSAWTSAGSLYIGESGTDNRLILTNGGTVSVDGDALVGYREAASGNKVLVAGSGSVLAVGGEFYVSQDANDENSMTISGGGRVLSSGGYIGSFSGLSRSNSVLVEGPGSIWTNSGDFSVGQNGRANMLIISNGGTVSNLWAYVGEDAGASSNRVVVEGAGSVWTSEGGLYIGGEGSGNKLLVASGGRVTVSSGDSYVGSGATASNNAVTIAGSGSILTVQGLFTVGGEGRANSLVISNGANVTSDLGGIVGEASVSEGNSALVAGAGSVWSSSGEIIIGDLGGDSLLTLKDGGTIKAQSLVVALQEGSSGTVDIGRTGGADNGGLVDAPEIIFGDGKGVLNFNQRDAISVRSAISGSGALNQLGQGSTTLTGDNSHVGGTTVVAGKLIAASETALGSGAVSLLGGTLQLQSRLDLGPTTWDGAAKIGISQVGKHWIDLGTNSLSLLGGTNFFDLAGASLGAAPLPLISSANMSGFAAGRFGVLGIANSRLLVTNNTLSVALAALIAEPGGSSVTGTVTYPKVVFEPSALLAIEAGANLSVESTVVVDNRSSTTVNGRFTASGGFVVEPGSALGGSGMVVGNLVNAGRVGPGNSPGALQVVGNFTQLPSGATEIEVASQSVFDRLVVSGTAALAGMLQVVPVAGYTLQFGDKYQFLTARGGISGEYDNIAMPSGYRGRLLVGNTTSGTLLVAPQSYTQMAVTPNQRRIAHALDAFIPSKSGDRMTVSVALDESRASEYPSAFEAIMPSLYASLPTLAFNQANALNTSMFQRMWAQRINGTGFSTSGMRAAALRGEMGGSDDLQIVVAGPEPMRRWGAFVDGNGVFATANSAGMLQNYKSQSGGVTAGASYKWSENLATGVYVGYQGLQAQYDGGSRVTDNAVRFGGFGTLGIGGWYLNGLAGGVWHTYDIDRSIEFGTIDRTARANPDAGEFDLAVATGYDFKAGNFTFGPVTSWQFTCMGVRGFEERGADSLDLDVDPYGTSSMLYSLGAQIAYRWEIGKNFAITPMLSASWQHEFLQNPYPVDASFNAGGLGSSFFFQTSQPQQDYFMAGAGLGLEIGESWQISFFWNAVSGNADLASQNIYLSVGAEF